MVSTTETEEITATSPPNEIYNPATDFRRNNFTRSPSIEKIIKFNTYICSQNFFILPSILTWLKTSQTILKSYADKCINPIKATVYNFFLYKTLDTYSKLILSTIYKISLNEFENSIRKLRRDVFLNLGNNLEIFKKKILRLTVYFTFLFIFLQLFVLIWSLSGSMLPGGLIFMLVSLTLISCANFQCLRFITIEEILKKESKKMKTEASRKYIRPRDILGKRTISNLNLF